MNSHLFNGLLKPPAVQELVEKLMGPRNRVDLQRGQAANGELYLTSRQEGMIRTLVPEPDRPSHP